MFDIRQVYNELKESNPNLTFEKTNVLAEKYMNMRLIDDDLMRVALNNNNEAVQSVIRPIIGNNTLKVKSSVVQDDIQLFVGIKAVKLDIVAYDENGTIYNIEFQKDIAHANPERARYHCSMLDSKLLTKGSDTKALPECYVIFITEKDYFGSGEQIYHIDRRIEETEKAFVDKQHIIYVNCEKEDDSELGKLIHDLLCSKSETMHNRVLANAADGAKGLEDLKMYITGIVDNEKEIFASGEAKGFEAGKVAGIEEGRVAGIEEGRVAGIEEGRVAGITQILKTMSANGMTVQDIAKNCSLSEDEVQEILKN